MRIIGLTGGICSGKSTCIEYFKKLGKEVVDCDKLGHQTYVKGTDAYKQIVKTFGKNVLDDKENINRKELGKIVFSEKSEMEKLKKIVWPEIEKLIIEEIKKAKDKKLDMIVFEAALLLEAKWDKLMSEVWVLSCREEIAKGRLIKRNKLNEEEADKRFKSQMANKERRKKGDVIINSEVSREEVRKQIDKFIKFIPKKK